jgi:hypothetical protein
MQAGADKSLADSKGRTPMDVATAKGYQGIIDVLEGRGRAAGVPSGSTGGMMQGQPAPPAQGTARPSNAPATQPGGWGTGGTPR